MAKQASAAPCERGAWRGSGLAAEGAALGAGGCDGAGCAWGRRLQRVGVEAKRAQVAVITGGPQLGQLLLRSAAQRLKDLVPKSPVPCLWCFFKTNRSESLLLKNKIIESCHRIAEWAMSQTVSPAHEGRQPGQRLKSARPPTHRQRYEKLLT